MSEAERQGRGGLKGLLLVGVLVAAGVPWSPRGAVPLGVSPARAADSAPAATGSSGMLDEKQAQQFIAQVKPAVVLLEVEGENGMMAWGSGFFVSSDGLLVTNRHVVEDTVKVSCLFKNKTKLPAKVLKIDEQYDLAIVKVDTPSPVPTVALGDSEEVSTGQLVAVTGYPQPGFMVWMGMALDSSTSRGAVNGLRFGGDANTMLGDQALQIDAPVTHGNSGGPVFNLNTGQVIGVLASGSAGAGNVTFAVPINQAKVLMAGAGLKLQPSVPAAGSPEAVVEPGDLRALNTVSATKELPRLFGYGFPFGMSVRVRAQEAYDDWEVCTGSPPPNVTSLVLHNNEIFFGATDGKLRRWNLNKMMSSETATTLLDVGKDKIMVYPPAVNKDMICAVAGAVDLSLQDKGGTGEMIKKLFSLGGNKKVLTIEGEGTIYGLNRRNGNIDWTVDTGFVGTPVIYDNKVYYGGLGIRGCVDAFQGQEVWKATSKTKDRADWYHIGYAGKLGMFGVRVPVEAKNPKEGPRRLQGQGKTTVQSYDPGSGKVLWETEIGDLKERLGPLNTAMFVDENAKVVYALATQQVAAVSATDGKLLWVYDHAKKLEENLGKVDKEKKLRLAGLTPNLVIYDGVIYIGSADRHLYALNGSDGTPLWTYTTRGAVGQPAYYDGQIIVGSSDGYLHVLDAKTGRLNWRVATGGSIQSRPLVRAGMVYAATEEGQGGAEIVTVRIPAS